MTYRVQDGDANTAASDAATLTFTITVEEAPAPDTAPSFGLQTVPNQSYTVGVAISALVLPQASGGNGSLPNNSPRRPPGAARRDLVEVPQDQRYSGACHGHFAGFAGREVGPKSSLSST